jgi:BirA family transcriptional regulator, biotin operon repressor / biotin---[acetyl-CoA-carboxylase] ligase
VTHAHNSPIGRTGTTRADGAPLETLTDARLGHIVRLLSDNATLVVSGTRIAEELGTTRSEVWRVVQHLRELGVRIAGYPSSGYQLESVADLLLPEFVGPLIGGTIFASRIHHYFRIGSTNTTALEAAASGEPEGSVFFAEEQTAGRGRGNNTWESVPSEGIYCSVILRPQLAPVDALLLSLIAGLAVCDAVHETTGLQPDLRWPNDVLIGERKFCGVLTEMHAEATRVRYVIVGIGINVNHVSFSPELEPIATSLRIAAGHERSRVQVAAALLKSLDAWYRKLSSDTNEARAEVLRAFEKRSSYARSRQVHVDEAAGYDGVTEGLDERGFLRVRTNNGVRTVLSGLVRALPSHER